jgi:ribonucleoside-diphosphate reductase alpha chain
MENELEKIKPRGGKMSTYDDAYAGALEYFDGDELAAGVWTSKYALQNLDGGFLETSPEQMHHRLAGEFARIEAKYDNSMSKEEIFDLLDGFKYIVPQGSPMSAIGNKFQIQSVSNCFVVDSPIDSYGGILKTDQEQVQIMKRRGGVGFDISNIRPKGMPTSNAAKTTDGIGIFMERFSNSCREVAQGNRRGALMITISVHHPDIRTFIDIKKDKTKVTGANISIRLSDEFMHAVESDSDTQLRWPVEATGSDVKVLKMTSAKALWEDIVSAAHASAEPGILFWDNILDNTPANIYEPEGFGITSTNPCSELVLSPNDSCRLLLLNTTSFVKSPFESNSKFDFKLFSKLTRKAQRLMDDMVDIEIDHIDNIIRKIRSDPEPEDTKAVELNLWMKIRKTAETGRRTGLGMTGLGDTVAMLGLRYGSDESIAMIEKITKELAVSSYTESCMLAAERGAFGIYSFDREVGHPFMERLFLENDALRKLHLKHGRRNISISTIAPCGSVSCLTQTTSGIEPSFMLEYVRRKKIPLNVSSGDDLTIDFIDEMGDKWQHFSVYHHNFKKWMDISGKSDPAESPYHMATSAEIDWESGVKLQAAAQKWICHAISKTTNLPSTATAKDVDNIYRKGWKMGLKGITVYVEGSRDGVLISKDEAGRGGDDAAFGQYSAPRRPDGLPCEIHRASIKGEAWTILVGLMDGRPYEVFGGLSKYVEIPRSFSEGVIAKRSRKTRNSIYDLSFGEEGDEFVVKNIVEIFDNPNYSAFTRTISLGLRHGAPVNYMVEQLQKDKDADFSSFSKVVARVLKKYISDGTAVSEMACSSCGSEGSLIYQEGCATCLNCGVGRCG